jgi:hypothetical protein
MKEMYRKLGLSTQLKKPERLWKCLLSYKQNMEGTFTEQGSREKRNLAHSFSIYPGNEVSRKPSMA